MTIHEYQTLILSAYYVTQKVKDVCARFFTQVGFVQSHYIHCRQCMYMYTSINKAIIFLTGSIFCLYKPTQFAHISITSHNYICFAICPCFSLLSLLLLLLIGPLILWMSIHYFLSSEYWLFGYKHRTKMKTTLDIWRRYPCWACLCFLLCVVLFSWPCKALISSILLSSFY